MAQTYKPIWQNSVFKLFRDSVVQQNKFTGKAVSATEIISDYKSPVQEFKNSLVTFKFSINGKDNEMKPGTDHHYSVTATDGIDETPVIKFGQQSIDNKLVADNTYLRPRAMLKIRVDMRDVLNAFEKTGYYTTYNGDKIYKSDFKGLYIAGNAAPLSWDFDNLVNMPALKMTDHDNDGIYENTLTLNDPKNEKQTSSTWKRSKDVSAFPQYSSAYPISDAAYNLAIEEMVNAVEPDSTFRTGKEWAGVWTRDISYSIILAMAQLQPKVAKYSLLRKVNKNKRIIQDTGTGGAWPASTDRMIWATAAWELYKVTGDKAWLRQAYQVIRNSADDDSNVAYDKVTGLVKGESSFLDWREQTYPKWMQPADIYESFCLGTNAVHYQANVVLASMAALLNDKPSALKYKLVAERIKAGINNYLWLPAHGYYGQYLYGRCAKIISPRSEALGEALTVLFDIADAARKKQVISRTPVMEYGVPCIYPQIPGIPPYHNNAVWPFVQSYYALAAARAGNENAVMESIAAIYRPAALWATNKENFVASNGDYAGTQINSSNMLWSLSGSISLVYKLLFGIQYHAGSISFSPFVPQALAGKRSLTNFTYRKAVLDIEMDGYGNEIKSFMVDGKSAKPVIAATLRGKHTIKIKLTGNKLANSNVNAVAPYTTVATPAAILAGNSLSWGAIDGAKQYSIIKNGKELLKTAATEYTLTGSEYAEYQVIALDKNEVPSFASEPVAVVNNENIAVYEIESSTATSAAGYKGYSGKGFVELSKTVNTQLSIPINIPAGGMYLIDFRYANGNGPTNTENKCATRTLRNGGNKIGTVILPQRGKEEWSNWGFSNQVKASFTKGTKTLVLTLEPANENMNGPINQAMLDYVRIIKVE